MVASAVQIQHHHARFVAVNAVLERADAGKTPVAPGLDFAIDEKMPGDGAIEIIEDRLRRDEAGALI